MCCYEDLASSHSSPPRKLRMRKYSHSHFLFYLHVIIEHIDGVKCNFFTYVTLCKSQTKMFSVSVPLSTARFFAVKSFKTLSSSNLKYTNALLLVIVTLIINIPIRSMVTKLLTKYTEHDSKPNHSDNRLCSNPQTCFSHKNANLLYCGVCC